MNRIIVTGGSGFIGTNLIDDLLKNGCIVLNIDISKPVKEQHVPHWMPVDILNYKRLEEVISAFKPDSIVHLAAVTDLDGTDLKYYNCNTHGTKNVIDIAKSIPTLKKVLYTSSMYVCRPGDIPIDYDTYTPHTFYGESKVEGEKLVKNIKDVNYDWVIVRPTSIWGPGFKIPYIDFFRIVRAKKFFKFPKACVKTYGYIGNTVYQIKTLLEADNVNGRTFYLGDEPAINIAEWGDEISREMGNGPLKSVPFFFLKLGAITGDVLKTMNIRFPITSFRLSNMTTDNVLPVRDIYQLAEQPPYSRLEGVKETVAWLQKNDKTT